MDVLGDGRVLLSPVLSEDYLKQGSEVILYFFRSPWLLWEECIIVGPKQKQESQQVITTLYFLHVQMKTVSTKHEILLSNIFQKIRIGSELNYQQQIITTSSERPWVLSIIFFLAWLIYNYMTNIMFKTPHITKSPHNPIIVTAH